MKNYVTINYKGQAVACYPKKLNEEDNILMSFNTSQGHSLEDTVENFNETEAHKNWTEAVRYIIDKILGEGIILEQLEAV